MLRAVAAAVNYCCCQQALLHKLRRDYANQILWLSASTQEWDFTAASTLLTHDGTNGYTEGKVPASWLNEPKVLLNKLCPMLRDQNVFFMFELLAEDGQLGLF
jgi:hypothetical protein